MVLSANLSTRPFSAAKRIGISNRLRAYTNGPSNGTWQSGTYRSVCAGMSRTAFSALQATWGNYNAPVGVETVGPNSLTINASLDYGGYSPFAFSSASTVAIAGGATATSDTLAVRIPAGAEFYIRTYIATLTAGQKWPLSFPNYFAGLEGHNAAAGTVADLTGGGSVPVPASSQANSPYAPMFVTGIPEVPTACWLHIGDSITYGQGDVQFPMTGCANAFGMGWPDRALNGACGSINLGTQGDRQALFVGTGSQYRLGGNLLSYATHATLMYGRNDLSNGITSTQFLSDLSSIIVAFNAAGIKCYPCTILPKTSSTDSWATLVNQNAGVDSVRVAINTAIRAGISGAAGYFECANAVESSQDSGLWKVTGVANAYTNDGIHPSPVGHAAIGAAVGPSMSLVP